MNDFKPHSVWIHNKTGNRYKVYDTAIDSTNATEGRQMVTYERIGQTQLYVREIKEFVAKFTKEFSAAPAEVLITSTELPVWTAPGWDGIKKTFESMIQGKYVDHAEGCLGSETPHCSRCGACELPGYGSCICYAR